MTKTITINKKKYEVLIYYFADEDGWSVSIPALKGCWSEGNTEEESIKNIKSSAKEWPFLGREMGNFERGGSERLFYLGHPKKTPQNRFWGVFYG